MTVPMQAGSFQSSLRDLMFFGFVPRHCAALRAGLITVAPPALRVAEGAGSKRAWCCERAVIPFANGGRRSTDKSVCATKAKA